MSDTSFSKPSHTNGPSIKLYDLGGLPYPQGPYAEAAAMLGWDPVGLQWVKVHVDSNGNINTVGGTTTSTIAGSVIVTQGTASNLNATVVGTVTSVPSGTQPVSGTVTSISGTASNLLAQVSGTVTSVPSGTQSISIAAGTAAVTQATSPWVVSQGTASNFQATVTGTVALSGTQTVVGTVTNVPSGTQAVSQTGSPWGVSGTVTTTPSGTQNVAQTGRFLDLTGSATITSTANSLAVNLNDVGAFNFAFTGTFTGSINVFGFVGGAATLLPVTQFLFPGTFASVANPIVLAGAGFINVYTVDVGGFSQIQFGPTAAPTGTLVIQYNASQAQQAVLTIPVGTTTIAPTGTQSVSVAAGTVTVIPSGTQAVSQSGAPWSVAITTQTGTGVSMYTNIALSTVGTAIKAAAGNLYGYDLNLIGVAGTAAGTAVVKFYNKATAPTGTDTPVITIPLNAAIAANQSARLMFDTPAFFSTGISVRASLLIATADATAPTGTVVSNVFFS